MRMTQVPFKHKLSGLIPSPHWKNPKRHISALVKGGKILAYGESSLGGTPYFITDRGRSCHSEMSVLKCINSNIKNRRKLGKCTLWNIRWTRKGDIVNSKPCLHCQKTLIRIGVKNIVFSTDDGTFVKAKLASLQCYPSSGYRK